MGAKFLAPGGLGDVAGHGLVPELVLAVAYNVKAREEMEERVVRLLHEDPRMRQEFINRVAAPIANKLFECGLIP